MSRVDEALHRAAGRGTDTTNRIGSPTWSTAAGDLAELLLEPFPSESPAPQDRPDSEVAPTPVSPPMITAAPPTGMKEQAPAARPLVDRVNAQMAGRVVVDPATSPTSLEQYRRIGAALHHHQEATGLKIVMVTSAAVSEGKTLTSANLALTLSESYRKKVLLIDADLRRPTIQRIFRIEDGPGLSESLMTANRRGLPVHRVSSRLGVVTGGQATSDPIAGLTSQQMHGILDEARDQFDWVIIDTPPVALLPDASLLGAMVDGIVLVIKAEGPSYELVQRAVDAIGRSKIVGVVLNHATMDAEESSVDDYYNSYYSRVAVKAPPARIS